MTADPDYSVEEWVLANTIAVALYEVQEQGYRPDENDACVFIARRVLAKIRRMQADAEVAEEMASGGER